MVTLKNKRSKMATKNRPGKFDCYTAAAPDEPMFVLLARDRAAPIAIWAWIEERLKTGKNDIGDEQIQEAFYCMADIIRWQTKNSNGQQT